MEVPELKSPYHDKGGALKLQVEVPSDCGSAAEMDRTGKSSIRIIATATTVCSRRVWDGL